MLGARDRMGRHEMRVVRQDRLERRDDGALDRTDVRDDRALLERRRDGAPDRLVGADRRAKNHAIGAAHGARQIVGDDVAERQAPSRAPSTPTE